MTKQIPGYDREIITEQDKQEFFEEAERRGHIYNLFIDGQDNPSRMKDGAIFQADSLEEAKQMAYREAWRESNRLDGTDGIDYIARNASYKEKFGDRDTITGDELLEWLWGCSIEDIFAGRWENAKSFKKEVETPPPPYPTHAYKLYHQGKLVVDYTPPNPDDVASGKVVMPSAIEVSDGVAPLPDL